jgi:hypothetical protein
MARIRSTSEIQEKWSSVTPQRTQQYSSGVSSPLRDWGMNTKAAEPNFEQGVQKAIASKSFGKGVNAAGTDKWQEKTLALGTQRWAPGVSAAADDYGEGFAPFRDVIEKTTLPPRYPRGDARNMERVRAIGQALHDKRVKG